MQKAAIIAYRDDGERPRAEVMLTNGDRLRLELDRDGLTITQADGPLVFRANSAQVSHLCAGLIDLHPVPSATPLQILLGAVLQLASAAAVKAAFEKATGEVKWERP